MYKKRKVTIFIVAFICILQSVNEIFADKTYTSTMEIVYTKENKYQLSVVVMGDGFVKDGGQEIRNGHIQYQCSLDTQKNFQIVPDNGSVIKSVKFIRPEFSKEDTLVSKKGFVQIDVESTEMYLKVEFSSNQNKTEKPILTNDKMILKKYIFLELLSIIIVVLLVRRKRAYNRQ